MNAYTTGTIARLTATFTDATTGAVTDPTAVTAEIRLPDGSVTTGLTVTKQSTGVYYTDYTVSDNGTHVYRFAGTGAVWAAGEQHFIGVTSF